MFVSTEGMCPTRSSFQIKITLSVCILLICINLVVAAQVLFIL
jgi:hypothetical protein